MRWFATVILVLLAGLAPRTALSQSDGNAMVTARANMPIPANAGLSVEFEQDTETNNRLVPLFAEELRRRGYAVGENLRLVLSFDTEVGERSVKARDLFQIEWQRARPDQGFNRAEAHIPLLQGSSSPSGKRFDLSARVFERGGKVLWEGRLIAVLLAVDRNKAFRAMVPVLMTHLDESTNGAGKTGN